MRFPGFTVVVLPFMDAFINRIELLKKLLSGTVAEQFVFRLDFRVADRVIFINEGVVKENTTPTEFFSNPEDPRLKEFLSKML